MNYIITRLVHRFIEEEVNQRGKHYEVLSDGVSVLKDALDEYTDKVLKPYEDIKKKENGSVSELDK